MMANGTTTTLQQPPVQRAPDDPPRTAEQAAHLAPRPHVYTALTAEALGELLATGVQLVDVKPDVHPGDARHFYLAVVLPPQPEAEPGTEVLEFLRRVDPRRVEQAMLDATDLNTPPGQAALGWLITEAARQAAG